MSLPAPPEGAGRNPRHASPQTRLRRWLHRHRRQRLQDYQAPKVARWPRLARGLIRALAVTLLLVGSILVYLVAWQIITTTVSDDVNPDARPRQVQQGAIPARPPGG